MPGRLIAIGDIHGCATALATLLNELHPTQGDIIVTLGDYVDRGPDSKRVLELLLDLQQKCSLVPLLGNHEIAMLAAVKHSSARRGWFMDGGGATVESYGGFDQIPTEHLEFIERCRPYHETEQNLFVHANYEAGRPLDQQDLRTLACRSLDQLPPKPHCSGKIAVVGHTAQSSHEILDLGFLICIDTHCYDGGWLTALDVLSGQTWQASDNGDTHIRSYS